jgi:hypothetical protein
MKRRVAPVRTDISKECIASIVRVKRTDVRRLLVTANVVPNSPIHVTLMMEAIQEPHDVTSQKTVFLMKSAVFSDVTPCGSCIIISSISSHRASVASYC